MPSGSYSCRNATLDRTCLKRRAKRCSIQTVTFCFTDNELRTIAARHSDSIVTDTGCCAGATLSGGRGRAAVALATHFESQKRNPIPECQHYPQRCLDIMARSTRARAQYAKSAISAHSRHGNRVVAGQSCLCLECAFTPRYGALPALFLACFGEPL